ncbi:MAG: HNH endonuclease [Okeania sp. SIO2D1]|nr:HNH endonuclease [Okeania sp. SIO2D1]
MAQTKIGALRIAAQKIGVTLEEYIANKKVGLKWCTKCKQWKHIENFGKDKSRYDGLNSICKSCKNQRKTSGPGRKEREAKKLEGLKWCRGCQKYLPSEEVVKSGVCKLHAAAEARQRYANNEKHRLERRQHSHSRKRNVDPIPYEGQKFLMEIFEGKCAYCLKPANTWDHIIPISKGGQTTPGNVVPACIQCNSSKNNQDVFEWMDKKSITPHPEFIDRIIISECGLYG